MSWSSSARLRPVARRRRPLGPPATAAILLVLGLAAACARLPRPGAPAAAAGPARAALVGDLDRALQDPVLARALVAVDIRSLATGERLFARDADKLVIPASNMKILTLAAAAEQLGWDFRFATTLVSDAPLEAGVLRGDLIVVGSGDPTIGSREDRAARVFAALADQLLAAGVHRIDGRLVGDDDAFEEEGLGAGWSWDYLSYGYAAPVGALQYNENSVQITLTPGRAPGDAVAIGLAPPWSGLTLDARVTTGPAGGQAMVDLFRLPGSEVLRIEGSLPAGGNPLQRTISVDNPTTFFLRALRAALVARGLDVRGGIADIDTLGPDRPAPAGGRVLASVESPPLREIARVLMQVSQNLYAETLLKALDRQAHPDRPGSAAGGREVVRAVMERWGVAPDGYVQLDGSGLSRYNYVTAATIVTVLAHLYGDARHRDAFLAALPLAGRDGTLANRLKGTRAEANVRAKTGSIANVRALSGYVTTEDGEPLVFAIVVNHFTAPAAAVDAIVDRVVDRLARARLRPGARRGAAALRHS
jgi:D-alanyl-D-alanine carboxypeptidase/D-alanyl-D-alanine-endopeptidase (penicillin-binding protein 4)